MRDDQPDGVVRCGQDDDGEVLVGRQVVGEPEDLGEGPDGVLAFSVVTESIFAWPGMGKLLIESLLQLDRPVVVAYLMIIVAVFVIINLVVDVLYSLLDPRVRLREQGT